MKGTHINPSFYIILESDTIGDMFDCLYMLMYTVLILSTDLSFETIDQNIMFIFNSK